MASYPTLPALLVILILSLQTAAQVCGPKCKFRLCSANEPSRFLPNGPRIPIRTKRVSGFPFICRPSRRLGRIIRTGEPLVSRAGLKQTPISKFRPRGFTGRFSKRFFQAVPIPLSADSQGIATAVRRGNEYNFLGGLCVTLPIETYQTIRGKQNKTRITRGRQPAQDCVSFIATTPDLVIDLSWSGREDLDLFVRGPGKSRGRLTSGRVLSGCRGGEETIVVDKARRGIYTVVYRHHPDEQPPSSFTTRQRDVGQQLQSMARWHPNYLLCTDPPRNTAVGFTTRMASGLPITSNRRTFKYAVTVTWKGNVIVKKTGKARVGEHGGIGMLKFKCSSVACRKS